MLTYLLIFCAKIIEVSLTTIRTVLITKGEKLYGAIIGFFEVCLWLYVISSVLSGITEDPIRMLVYAFGFACGNYLGCIIEDKIALGLITINVISKEDEGIKLAKFLRERNIGVTVIDGEGLKEKKKMLIIHVKRKRKKQIVKLIEETEIPCVISINDIKGIYGGYGLRK